MNFQNEVLERFLRYVKINTQSSEASETSPSTAAQLDLSRLLVKELRSMGFEDVVLTDHGVVLATLRSTAKKAVPTIFFCSHVDTSYEVSGAGVKPIVHRKYDGSKIVLPDDTTQVLDTAIYPSLRTVIGHDIVTASGTTLLGADDKAGIAAIMTSMQYLAQHPEIVHGPLRVVFTPDEEIGSGTKYVTKELVGAECGYTVDGDGVASIETENFNAANLLLRVFGKNSHPGYAKEKGMINSIRMK